MHGDWSIDKACLQDTIWGHAEVGTDEWVFIIEPYYDDIEILTEKIKMISLLNTEDTVQIMNDLRTLSMQKFDGEIKNKFELLVFIPGVTKVTAGDIFVGTIEEIIGELNRLFSPEEMEED